MILERWSRTIPQGASNQTAYRVGILLVLFATVGCASTKQGERATNSGEDAKAASQASTETEAGPMQLAVEDGMVCTLKPPGAIRCVGAFLQGVWTPDLGADAKALATTDNKFIAQTVDGGLHSWKVDPRDLYEQMLGGGLSPPEVDDLPATLDFTFGFTEQMALCEQAEGRVQCAKLTYRGGRNGKVELLDAYELVDWAHGRRLECGVDTEGSILCRGSNRYGQLGMPPGHEDDEADAAVRVSLPGDVAARDIETTGRHVCAISEKGDLYCWGANARGQTGHSGDGCDKLSEPQRVELPGPVAQVVLYGERTCARLEDGSLHCWGHFEPVDMSPRQPRNPRRLSSNTIELGPPQGSSGDHGCEPEALSPVEMLTIDTPALTTVTTTDEIVCGVTQDEKVMCVGDLLGLGVDSVDREVRPRRISSSGMKELDIAAVAVAERNKVCLVTRGGGMACEINRGAEVVNAKVLEEIGRSKSEGYDGTVDEGRYNDVSAATNYACFLSVDGKVRCFGSNAAGQLGVGLKTDVSDTLVDVPLDGTFVDISAGAMHACAIREDGETFCWGLNDAGQVGGDGKLAWAPRRIDTSATFTAVATGRSHTCALDDGGAVWCWGRGPLGQLGLSDSRKADTPTRIELEDAAVEVTASATNTCARTKTGDVWCWGGFGETQPLGATPTRIDLSGPASDVQASMGMACALLESGEVYCWGGAWGDKPTQLHHIEDTEALGETALGACALTRNSSIFFVLPGRRSMQQWSDRAVHIQALEDSRGQQ